jgi:hypothetical protein
LIPEFDVVPIKSLAAAIDRGLAALAAEDIDPPRTLSVEGYRRPAWSKAS